MREHRSWFIAAGMAILISVWLLSGTLSPQDSSVAEDDTVIARPANDKAPPSVRVRTQTAEEVQRLVSVNGETAPARIVTLAAETDGRVIRIGAERGANVDAGHLIVQLDERDRSARLEQARAMLKQREVEYEARNKLKSSSYVSEAQLQEAIAALEAARTELKRAQLDLEYMTVRAPFDGALQSRDVEIGDFVSKGDPIASFVDNRTIIVSANLSEFDAAHVTVGAPGSASLATGETVKGKIRYVAPVADASTRTFTVELEVDNSDGHLRAGGTAELAVPTQSVLAHRISPSLLTLDDAGDVGVKIVNDAEEVEFVVTDIAQATANGVWVTGLPEEATIITVGQGFVADGTVVDAVPEGSIDTAVAIKSRGD